MASASKLTALPEYDSSKAINVLGLNQINLDTASSVVTKKRQNLSDLFTIVSAPYLVALAH